jgi:hypothetical protein
MTRRDGWRVIERWLWWDIFIDPQAHRIRPAKGGHETPRTFDAEGPAPHVTRAGRGMVGRLRKGR